MSSTATRVIHLQTNGSSLEMAKDEQPVPKSDAQLWQELKMGSKQAMNLLFYRHYHHLFDNGNRIARDEDITKDCIQELFVEIWNQRARLMDVRSVLPYLLTCLRRRIIKMCKRQSRFGLRIPSKYSFEIIFSHEDFLVNEQLSAEQAVRLQRAINLLPKRQREILYLKYYNDLSYEEIIKLLGTSYQTLRNQLHSAVKLLRLNLIYLPHSCS
jgi:RNA polymerase sigma factor (sigma-70 family)